MSPWSITARRIACRCTSRRTSVNGRGTATPGRSTTIEILVPGVPRSARDASSTVQPRVEAPSTAVMRSPVTIPAASGPAGQRRDDRNAFLARVHLDAEAAVVAGRALGHTLEPAGGKIGGMRVAELAQHP